MTTSTEYVLAGPRQVAASKRHLDDLPATWARVRILHCGICGSDLSKFDGRRAIAYPHSVGHEFVGVVAAVGTDVSTLQVGDTVTSDLNFRCGECAACERLESHLCARGQISMFTNRAFAEYLDISAVYLVRLEVAAASHLTLAEPLSCVLHAMAWTAPRASDRVLLIGAGGLGLCAAFALSTGPPISFEVIDRIRSRATLIADAADGGGQAITAIDPGQFDVVVDISGSVSGLRLACQAVRAGGRLCTLSHLDGYGPTPFLLPALTRRDVQFKLSYLNGERRNLETAATMLAANWSDAWDAATASSRLRSLQSAFEQDRRTATCKTIIDVT